jgi:hypothetical protein
MANEKVGFINCPTCENKEATVHREKKQKKLYMRCYTQIDGTVMRCGTSQIRGPEGQKYINNHMRPLSQEAIAPQPMKEPEKEAIAPKKKTSIFDNFWNDEE